METLQTIINTGDPREIKRAIAVKMHLSGIETLKIAETLGVSEQFVSKWKLIHEKEGAEALLLQYEGSESFLNQNQRTEVVKFLSEFKSIRFEEVVYHLENKYGVIYKSKQSYYDLLKESRISWHKTKKANPKKDEKLIASKREEIKKN
jgi:putative transposase